MSFYELLLPRCFSKRDLTFRALYLSFLQNEAETKIRKVACPQKLIMKLEKEKPF